MFTTSTDHCSLIIEIDTGEESNGKGTFRAPPNIHNDAVYQDLARECMMDAHLKCKDDTEQKTLFGISIAERRKAGKVVRDNKSFATTFQTMYGTKRHKEQTFHDNLKHCLWNPLWMI